MEKKRHLRVSLLAKVLAAVSILLVATFGALSYYQLREARSTIIAVQVANARTFARALAASLEGKGPLDGSRAKDIGRLFYSGEDESEILVIDLSGRIVQSYGIHHRDLKYDGPDIEETIRTGKSVWRLERHKMQGGTEQRLDVTWPIHQGDKIVGAVEISVSSDVLTESLNGVVYRTLTVDAIGALALFASLIFLMNLVILRPLSLITKCTERMAAGDMDQIINIRGGDELGELAKAFNHMSKTLKAKHRELETLATTDPLTGLANRRRFYEFLDEEIARQKRYGGRFALCAVDLDFFKAFNDEYGHIAGDSALKDVAAILSSSVRDSDLAARMGGEEFTLVLSGQGREEAQAVALRLLQAVRSSQFSALPEAHLTISAGIAVFPDDGGSAESLIKRADEALYQAKNEGRDRAVVSVSGRIA